MNCDAFVPPTSQRVKVAKIFEEQVQHPVVIAPPHSLMSKSIDQNGARFMIDGVIIRMVSSRRS